MSISCMNAVWTKSRSTGFARLVLLALADSADDLNYCWPGHEKIAKKAAISVRSVIRQVKLLEDLGELVVEHNRRKGNKYIVKLGLTDAQVAVSIAKNFSDDYTNKCDTVALNGEKKAGGLPEHKVTESHIRSDSYVTSEVTAMSHDPSITVNEPVFSDATHQKAPTPPANAGDVPALEPLQSKKRDPVMYPEDYTVTALWAMIRDGTITREQLPFLLERESRPENKARPGLCRDLSERINAVPAEQMTAMKNAIALAFGLDLERVTSTLWESYHKPAQALCKAGYTPEQIPAIFKHVQAKKFENWGADCLAKYASEVKFSANGHGQLHTPSGTLTINEHQAALEATRKALAS